MTKPTPRQQLVNILRNAYSGELAAAYAYRGHWKSLVDRAEREVIKRIEDEEWEHRHRLGLMLDDLESAPAKAREVIMWIVGRTAGALCHFTGWFLPMYFAGRLESGNVGEYEIAASHAGRLALAEYRNELLDMAGVEREHELFFMKTIAEHRLLPLMDNIFGWGRRLVPKD